VVPEVKDSEEPEEGWWTGRRPKEAEFGGWGIYNSSNKTAVV